MKSRSRNATNPLALRFKFERLRLGKAMQHARKMKKARKRGTGDGDDYPPHGPGSTTTAARSILDIAIDAYLKYKWCGDVEKALDDGIKFLQQYGDQLTEQQREDFRKDLASLLGSYSDVC